MRLVDIGSGSGAGGIVAARLLGKHTDIVLGDVNRKALAFSAVNAVVNDVAAAKTMFSDVLAGIEGPAAIIVANVPYLADNGRRPGGDFGKSLAVRIVEQSLERLNRGGRLILYSGTPIIGGADPLFEALRPILQRCASNFGYEEIDPDVFGEELDRQAYANADRIAAIGLTAEKRE